MRRAENFEGDTALGRTYNILFGMYTFSGGRKIDSKPKWKRYSHGFYFQIIRVWMHSWEILFLIDAYLKRQHLHLLVNNLCSTVVFFLVEIKYETFAKRTDEVDKIRNNLANSWWLPKIGYSKEDRKILLKAEREIFILFLIILSNGIFGIFFWALIPVLNFSSHERILPVPFPEIFYVRETPGYECLYAYHVFYLINTILLGTSYDLIYCSFLNQICGQFDILIKNLKQIQKIYLSPDYVGMVKGYEELSDEEQNGTIEMEVEQDVKSSSKIQRTTETLKILEASIRHHQLILR